MLLAYDPVRVLWLRDRTLGVIDALAGVRSTDPEAGAATHAARIARQGLEQSMMPLLERIIASDALLTWLTSVGGVIGLTPPVTGAQAVRGHELAELARAVIAEGDRADVEALRAALHEAAGTRAVLAAFFADLGGDQTAALMIRLGQGSEHPDEQLALGASVRDAVATASHSGVFPSGFAGALVDGFVGALEDDDVNPAAAMSFLFHGATFGTDLLVGVTRRVVEHERTVGEDDDLFGLWPVMPVGSVLNRAFDDGDGHAAPGHVRSEDPMYAVLEALTRNGQAGRAVFTDDELAKYLLGQRRYDHDGLRAVSAAVATAAAGPDVVPGARQQVLIDAAEVASAYVNHVGARPHLFDDPLHPAVSASAAAILGTHLFAVHETVLRPVSMPHHPRGDTVELIDESRPGSVHISALFDATALETISALAVREGDGLATIRAALDLHQRDEAAAAAAVIADGDVDEPRAFLEDAMVDAARLEAHFIHHAGHQAESVGRSKDDVISFWIDAAALSIDVGGDRVRGETSKIVVPIVGEALGPASDLAKELLAGHEGAAERNAEEYARDAADQLLYVWYRELHAADVVDPSLPASARLDGRLVSWAEFQALPPGDQQVVRNAMEEQTDSPIDAASLRHAIKVEQLPIYQQLADRGDNGF